MDVSYVCKTVKLPERRKALGYRGEGETHHAALGVMAQGMVKTSKD